MFWQTTRTRNPRNHRHAKSLRVESLECRRLLAVLTPTDPIVAAALVGTDLVISCSAPEANVLVTESGGAITVTGQSQPYYAAPSGNQATLQTDINTSGVMSATFTPASPLRDLKIKLAGVDSQVQVGDQSGDGVTVGRDLIISMPASTTSTQLAYDSISKETHLNFVLESDMIGRNLTITTGTTASPGTSEAAVITVDGVTVGSTALKGTLTITTNGDVPNMIGLSADDVVGNASVTTGGGNDLIAVVGTTVSGRLTISAGGGDNSILCTNDFNETQDSSLQTFVTVNTVFGDGQDDELTDPCVVTLADDLNAASSAFLSFVAASADIYLLNGSDGLFLSEVQVGGLSGTGAATLKTGNGNDTIVVDGVGATGSEQSSGNYGLPPAGEMGTFSLTTGNGANTVVSSLDWLGDPGYSGPAYGIDAAM